MNKRTRRFDAVASLGVRLAAPVVVAMLIASCGTGSSTGGTTGGGSSTNSSGMGGQAGAGGASGTNSSSSSSTGTGNTEVKCKANADCATNPDGHLVCDTATGYCVGCLPAENNCPSGQYCVPATNLCVAGCANDTQCGGTTPVCNTAAHTCVKCVVDDNCLAGTICASNHTCVPGCSPSHACQAGATCCGDTCFNVQTNVNHCGDCTAKCVAPANATAACVNGVCQLDACSPAYNDCNGDTTDGCEWNILQDGPCVCPPGLTEDCYQGLPGTQGKGACKGGKRTCNQTGTGWSACVGQVLPGPEICNDQIDQDCNGIDDDVVDLDGDGWSVCEGDCCEVPGAGCSSPRLVNPGAFEVLENGANDDCDPATPDTVPATCSTESKFGTVTALDVAAAMEICQTTTTNPPRPLKKWGVLSAVQLLANGAVPNAVALGDMQNKQTAIMADYGTGGIKPRPNNVDAKGNPKPHPHPNTNLTMAGLSTGVMRDQADPDYAGRSTELTTAGLPPAAYVIPHMNTLPSSAGCSGACPAGNGANDSVNIRLSIRVPTNAESFSYDFRFFSSEYWDFQCTVFNDFYLALFKSLWVPDPNKVPKDPPIPADKNISFDSANNPISVNNGFFDVCVKKGCNTCLSTAAELSGTGMQINNAGGGTSWLTTDASVVPGETIQLELMIFDVTDHQLDSVVLLDNFRWHEQPAKIGTHK
jgi:hypothetical protein